MLMLILILLLIITVIITVRVIKYLVRRFLADGVNLLLRGSRLKMLRNKCNHELLPSKLNFPPHSPSLNLTYFPDYVRNPDEIPSIQCDFSVLEWLAMIVLLSSLFLSSLSFTGSWTWENPFFFPFTGKTVRFEPATSTIHNLTSCLRRHCEEVD